MLRILKQNEQSENKTDRQTDTPYKKTYKSRIAKTTENDNMKRSKKLK